MGQKMTCRECGRQYDEDEIYEHHGQFVDPPYHYERDGAGLCLGCFLGIGLLD